MATGDKVFLADKETLDKVNSNVADVHARVGTTTDTGGSATSGTLMGKINALISSIASHVANWTAARAANLDAAVSSRESEANALARYNSISTNTGPNNNASATGTLSQKLSHIINQIGGMGQKKLSSKVTIVRVSAAGTHTLLNLTGGGRLEFIYTSMGQSTSPLTLEIDGRTEVINGGSGHGYIVQSLYAEGKMFYRINSNSASAIHFAATRPLFFKNTLKITVATTDAVDHTFYANYAVYE